MTSVVVNELSLTRHINAPRTTVWRCWTEAELLKQWYCPKPWRVTEADIDLRPGGRVNTVFEGPEGERHDNNGIYLEIVPLERLIFTDAFTEGFMPKQGTPFMTGFVNLSDAPGGGTTMTWGARHWSADDKDRHEAMGFHDGWNAAASQLDELAQQITVDQGDTKQPAARVEGSSMNTITPCLWFDGNAEEAASFYASILPDSGISAVHKAPADDPSGKEGDVLTVEFTLMGRQFLGLNGGPYFTFNEAVSFQIPVETQAEVERLSNALSAAPEAEQCGWVKDRFGLSWQIIPVQLTRLIADQDKARAKRVFEAMMGMKRIDIAAIERAAQA